MYYQASWIEKDKSYKLWFCVIIPSIKKKIEGVLEEKSENCICVMKNMIKVRAVPIKYYDIWAGQ